MPLAGVKGGADRTRRGMRNWIAEWWCVRLSSSRGTQLTREDAQGSRRVHVLPGLGRRQRVVLLRRSQSFLLVLRKLISTPQFERLPQAAPSAASPSSSDPAYVAASIISTALEFRRMVAKGLLEPELAGKEGELCMESYKWCVFRTIRSETELTRTAGPSTPAVSLPRLPTTLLRLPRTRPRGRAWSSFTETTSGRSRSRTRVVESLASRNCVGTFSLFLYTLF